MARVYETNKKPKGKEGEEGGGLGEVNPLQARSDVPSFKEQKKNLSLSFLFLFFFSSSFMSGP